MPAKLPEILAYDGRRLAEVRDEIDRLALIAVYSTLLRQFVVNQNIRAGYTAGEILASMETRLYTILNSDEGVKLPHIVDEVIETAKRVCEAAGGASLTTEQATTLRGVLSSAVSLDNPLFTLLFSRLADVLTVYMRGEEPTARELVGRFGFRPFETQLANAGRRLSRLMEHTLAVHADLYSRMLREKAIEISAGVAPGNDGDRGSGSTNGNNNTTEVKA